jgi:hypothetical protein
MGGRRRAHALLQPESIADQLIDLQTQVTHLRSSIGEKDTLPQT